MKKKTIKWLFVISLISLGVCMLHSSDIYGTANCDCNTCDYDEVECNECFHLGEETCSKFSCIQNEIYWAECDEAIWGQDCPYYQVSVKIRRKSTWKDGAPPECDDVDQGWFVCKQSTECSEYGAIGRCKIPIGSCGGAEVEEPWIFGFGLMCPPS